MSYSYRKLFKSTSKLTLLKRQQLHHQLKLEHSQLSNLTHYPLEIIIWAKTWPTKKIIWEIDTGIEELSFNSSLISNQWQLELISPLQTAQFHSIMRFHGKTGSVTFVTNGTSQPTWDRDGGITEWIGNDLEEVAVSSFVFKNINFIIFL